MKIKKHYKLIVGAILIFISGLLIGGGVAYVVAKKQEERVDPLQKLRTELFKKMIKELRLTPEQQIKIGIFLDKAMVRMKKFRLKHTPEILMIVKENHQDLKNILSPEQWKDYEGYRNDKLDKIQKSIP